MQDWLFILTLFIIGFILIFTEVIIIPGFGLAGILGTIALATACYTAFTTLSPGVGISISILSVIIFIALFKIFPKTAVWKKIRLSISENKNLGYDIASADTAQLLNKHGRSLTILRPSGVALIDNTRCDVITNGEFIHKNEKITVFKIEGTKIFVRKIEKS